MTGGRGLAALVFAALVTAIGGADNGPESAVRAQSVSTLNPGYDARFQFVRVYFRSGRRGGFDVFGGRRGGREPPWQHDYPRAERNFLKILDETTLVGPHLRGSNIFALDDPELFKHPVAYIVEVGLWDPSDVEVEALGSYLEKGGFLIVDDFRSPYELANFEFQIRRALPDAQLLQLDVDHEIFDSFFRIESLDLAPPTFPQFRPAYYGIFEDNDPSKRLVAIVNHNNDIAEYWEYSDRAWFPVALSNEAYKLGVNYVVYALTH